MKKSIFSGLAATAMWGFSNVLTKSLLAHFDPLSLLAIQLMSSNLLLWIILAFQSKSHLSKAESFKYSLPGVLQPGFAFALSMFGLNLTTANSEALIWAIESIVIIFLASVLLRERIGWNILLLAACGTCGTFMATSAGADMHFNTTMLIGNVLILAGVACAAFYSIQSQRQLIALEPIRLTALHQLSGLILVIVIWLICLPVLGVSSGLNALDFLLASISGITAYALPFCFYLITIKGIGAAKTSIFLALPPVFTIFGSFIVFGEQLNLLQWVGVLLAILAVIGICLSKSRVIRPKIALE